MYCKYTKNARNFDNPWRFSFILLKYFFTKGVCWGVWFHFSFSSATHITF